VSRIINSLRNEFIESQGITSISDATDFEKFCNFFIIQNEYSKTLNPETVTVGAGNDTGIDGIAIFVNGHLVEDISEVDDLLEKNGQLDVSFIMVQSKTSASFDTGDMLKFYNGVNDFFSEAHQLPSNDDIKHYLEISDYIFSKASEFRENPKLKLYYVTTGVFDPLNEHLLAIRDNATKTLENMRMFRSVNNNLLGEIDITRLYRKSKTPEEASFEFERKAILPKIEGVKEAYFGVLPFSEFVKILKDENGQIRNVFDDNVRDFQGVNNPVNKAITKTLEECEPSIFSILNNGITVVATDAKVTSTTFTILDYQIVNGCQTSNVLFEYQVNNSIDDLNVPFRLIVTSDEDLKSKITISTNNQTLVKTDQLAAMSEFQKNLELYYSSITGEDRLYYERRSKQYNSDKSVIKKRVITVANLLKTFSSMFRQDPHKVTTYYGSLARNIGHDGSGLFEKSHQFAPYYLAGLVFYYLEEMFRKGVVDTKYRKVKFYVTMLIPLLATDKAFPVLNSKKKCEAYTKEIAAKLKNFEECKKIYSKAISIIEDSHAPIDDKQALKSQKMTQQIMTHYKQIK